MGRRRSSMTTPACCAVAVTLLLAALGTPASGTDTPASGTDTPDARRGGVAVVSPGAPRLRALLAPAPGVPDGTGQVVPVDDVPLLATPAAPGDDLLFTFLPIDVDGDGDDDLAQAKGGGNDYDLRVADGRTGRVLWTVRPAVPGWVVAPVPSVARPGASDLLLFLPVAQEVRMRLLDGSDGTTRWEQRLPPAELVVWYGTQPAAGGHDGVVGMYGRGSVAGRDAAARGLTLQVRSLADGAVATARTLTSAVWPSAALAGDLDDDDDGEVYAFTPLPGVAANGGLLTAFDRSGDDVIRTPYVDAFSDETWLVGAGDVTGDRRADAVLVSSGGGWLETIAVVDAAGGAAAGAEAVILETLDQAVYGVALPGDIDGDGKGDVVASGPVFRAERRQSLRFDAIGVTGRIWNRSIDVVTDAGLLALTWWPHAGDLDGDGLDDVVALGGIIRQGWTTNAAVGQRDGAVLWQRRDAPGMPPFRPLFGDVDGDGGDDVAAPVAVSRVDFATSVTRVQILSGRNASPTWSHERALDSGAPFSGYLLAARLDGDATWDVVADYISPSTSSHFTEAVAGSTRAVLWTNP